MTLYLALFVISLTISAISLPFLKRFAFKYNFMLDLPCERKIHDRCVPRNGGVAIAFGVISSTILGYLLNSGSHGNNQFLGVMLGSIFSLLVGLYDDAYDMRPSLKLIMQLVCGMILFSSGFRIEFIIIPFWQSVHLPFVASVIITILWVVLVMNSLNLIDGIDGLAGGISLIASATLFTLMKLEGDGLASIIAISLIGSTLGFLVYNFRPANVFMGDGGSMFLGSVLSAISINAFYRSTSVAAFSIPIFVLAIPLLDTIAAFTRRILTHQHPFNADKKHIHHRLLNMGLTPKGITVILYLATILLGLFALITNVVSPYTASIIVTILGMILATSAVTFYYLTGKKVMVRSNTTPEEKFIAVEDNDSSFVGKASSPSTAVHKKVKVARLTSRQHGNT